MSGDVAEQVATKSATSVSAAVSVADVGVYSVVVGCVGAIDGTGAQQSGSQRMPGATAPRRRCEDVVESPVWPEQLPRGRVAVGPCVTGNGWTGGVPGVVKGQALDGCA